MDAEAGMLPMPHLDDNILSYFVVLKKAGGGRWGQVIYGRQF